MLGFSTLDLIAIFWFVLAWAGYSVMSELSPTGRRGLNARMHRYREQWMHHMLTRENRIMDGQIMASLQNGTAFFASTSLLAIGGSLALLRSAPGVSHIYTALPLCNPPSPGLLEVKIGGLVIIFVYAFFKFAWSYRLFNYAAVFIGAVPRPGHNAQRAARPAAERAASMNVVAGHHFKLGQRAFFFALAYLGWFVSGYVLIVSTAAV